MPLSTLLTDLFEDFNRPGMPWEAGVILVCMAAGWGLAQATFKSWLRKEGAAGTARVLSIGVRSFATVLAPLLTLALLVGARFALARVMPVNLVRVAIALTASLVLIRVAFYLLRRVFARQGTVGAAILNFEKIFALLVWLGVALYITGLWPAVVAALDDTVLPLGKHQVSLATILQALGSVAVLLMLALWAGAALEERLMRIDGMHLSLRVVTARMGNAVLVLVAVLASLSLVGIDLTVLSVFGGALGVGLGLGLQKIASNYVSGFVILLERSLTIGDMIAVDKFNGRVTQINTRYPVLQGLDGTETVLPNEMLVSGAVQNFSLSTPEVRVATQLTVAYDSDVKALLPLLERAVAQVPRVLAQPAPAATMLRYGADGFELEVGMWIRDPENGRGGVISEANLRIWDVLREQGVSLPSQTRELRIVEPDLGELATRLAAGVAGR